MTSDPVKDQTALLRLRINVERIVDEVIQECLVTWPST